eukprot:361740-Chlamydomonas_euryale.AAC.7
MTEPDRVAVCTCPWGRLPLGAPVGGVGCGMDGVWALGGCDGYGMDHMDDFANAMRIVHWGKPTGVYAENPCMLVDRWAAGCDQVCALHARQALCRLRKRRAHRAHASVPRASARASARARGCRRCVRTSGRDMYI